jgi:hypothetical protein
MYTYILKVTAVRLKETSSALQTTDHPGAATATCNRSHDFFGVVSFPIDREGADEIAFNEEVAIEIGQIFDILLCKPSVPKNPVYRDHRGPMFISGCRHSDVATGRAPQKSRKSVFVNPPHNRWEVMHL